jgi:hypothetical protein
MECGCSQGIRPIIALFTCCMILQKLAMADQLPKVNPMLLTVLAQIAATATDAERV